MASLISLSMALRFCIMLGSLGDMVRAARYPVMADSYMPSFAQHVARLINGQMIIWIERQRLLIEYDRSIIILRDNPVTTHVHLFL